MRCVSDCVDTLGSFIALGFTMTLVKISISSGGALSSSGGSMVI